MAVNKVILVGNVGRDPEVRYLENNVAVANFTLATTERGYTTRTGQTIPDRTEWHNIVLWRGLAQVAEKYVKKGTQVYIEGKIRSRSYDDKDGNKRYITEIYADNLVLLGRRSDAPAPAGQTTPTGNQQPYPTTEYNAPTTFGDSSQPFMPENDPFGGGGQEDDLPF
ncbi:MAG: single-stranded DNA-binding protein [Breznakibacter sp.]